MMIGKCLFGLGLVAVVVFPCFAVSAQTDEERVGRVAAAQVLGVAPLLRDKEAQEYVGLVGLAIANNFNARYKWRIGIFRSDTVNAFAMPGGYVLVSSGLLKILDSEDEIAFVIAHEMAHVYRLHHYQVVLRQRLAEQASKNLSAATQDSDIGKLAQISGAIYARGLDKFAEFEADRLGVEYLVKSGYDPLAAISVLEKLLALREASDPRSELLFSTHPSPAERLDALLQSGIDVLVRPSAESRKKRDSRFRQFRLTL